MSDEHTAPTSGPVRLPAGELVFAGSSFDARVLERVDEALAGGQCQHGRLEIETPECRILCLISDSAPFLAGIMENDSWSRMPLRELQRRGEQLDDPSYALMRTDAELATMTAVHFSGLPTLRSSTRLVDPAHVLQVLGEEGRDAVVAFERSGARSLLFLAGGRPRGVYFGSPSADPGEGDPAERLLVHAFAPSAAPGRVEVFTDLAIAEDADAGTTLARLAETGKPPPPMTVVVRLGEGRYVLQRPFTLPEVVIGRDPRCEISLDNLAVSRRHARIVWSLGRFVLEDLDSANGTRLNGTRIQSVPLSKGDRIEVGKFRISLVEQRDAPGLSETMLLASRPRASRLTLEWAGQSFDLEHGVVIGKGAGVDVVARGFSVRPVHARLALRGKGLELTCFGRARAVVNGERVRHAELVAGDRIQVGRSEFLVARRG